MMQLKELFKRAVKDFENGKRNARIHNYAAAYALYAKAAKNLLKALFISTGRRAPPKNASITYLNKKVGVEIEPNELGSVLEDEREELEEEAADVEVENSELAKKEDFVRNLIGYTWIRLNGR